MKMKLRAARGRLLRAIIRHRNGAVVDSVAAMTGNATLAKREVMSFGVSLYTLKEVVKRFKLDENQNIDLHELAEELFLDRIRELRIAAIYLADADRISKERALKLINSWQQLDVIENAASMLLPHTNFALELALELVQSNEPMIVKAGLLIAGRLVKAKKTSPKQISMLREICSELDQSNNNLLINVGVEYLSYALDDCQRG